MKTVATILTLTITLPACWAAADRAGENRRELAAPETIQGIPCARLAWLREDGGLRSCFLAREASIAGHRLPEGSKIHLDEDGGLDFCFLGQDARIEEHLCRGKGHGYMTAFHPGGRLRLCWLAEPETIQGVPCRRASFLADVIGPSVGVRFHDNGRLAGCKLDRDFTVQERTFRRGERVEFGPDGRLRAGEPSS